MTSETKRDMIRHWTERGTDITVIAKLLGLSVEEVQAVLDHPEPPKTNTTNRYKPEFIEPPLFE